MEVKLDIPFQQLLRIIRQLTPTQRKKVQAVLEQVPAGADESVSRRIMAFGGAFADMSAGEYGELADRLKDTRAGLFDRSTPGL